VTHKCVVWDLDHTLWDGVCLEGPVRLRTAARETLHALDARGILHAIASKGEEEPAARALVKLGIDEYFVARRINWLPKPTNIRGVARELGIATDTLAFVDDDPFELAQMSYMLPEVTTISACSLAEIPSRAELQPRDITAEARSRRASYRAESARRRAAASFPSREAFLASCGMQLRVRPVLPEDEPRVLELMARTHQLNSAGVQSDPEPLFGRLQRFSTGLLCELSDRFGQYGIVGVAFVAQGRSATLHYFAMSCRILGRGVERAFVSVLMERLMRLGGAELRVRHRDTGRNRSLRALFQMLGFRASGAPTADGSATLICGLRDLPAPPTWVKCDAAPTR
jgi:FkbH-like protein